MKTHDANCHVFVGIVITHMWSHIEQGHTHWLSKTALMPAEFKHHNLGSRAQVITDARPMPFKDEIRSSELCWLLSLRACSLARAAERILTCWFSVWPASDNGFVRENAR